MCDAWRAGEAKDPQSIVQLVNELARKQASRSGIGPAAQRILKHRAFSILLGYHDVPSPQVNLSYSDFISCPNDALVVNKCGLSCCDISYKKMHSNMGGM
jgi:hypothetical protein